MKLQVIDGIDVSRCGKPPSDIIVFKNARNASLK